MLELKKSPYNGRKCQQSKNRSPQNYQKLAKGPSKKEKEDSYCKTVTIVRTNSLIAVARGRPNKIKKPKVNK